MELINEALQWLAIYLIGNRVLRALLFNPNTDNGSDDNDRQT